mmetsp:Transcript_44038/g.116431  ORF Transcript_44038/g.116431 Transcript_44038/m.116431 type:complete len:262 (+) Transcript_44038:229-1014(+)
MKPQYTAWHIVLSLMHDLTAGMHLLALPPSHTPSALEVVHGTSTRPRHIDQTAHAVRYQLRATDVCTCCLCSPSLPPSRPFRATLPNTHCHTSPPPLVCAPCAVPAMGRRPPPATAPLHALRHPPPARSCGSLRPPACGPHHPPVGRDDHPPVGRYDHPPVGRYDLAAPLVGASSTSSSSSSPCFSLSPCAGAAAAGLCLLGLHADAAMSRSMPTKTRPHPTHCNSVSRLAGLRKTEYSVVKILRRVVTAVSSSGPNCVIM